MPEIEAFADIDPDDYFEACSSREKKELIRIVVEEASTDKALEDVLVESLAEEFPDLRDEVLNSLHGSGSSSFMRDEFISSLFKLGEAYYRLSNEDIEKINELAKRF